MPNLHPQHRRTFISAQQRNAFLTGRALRPAPRKTTNPKPQLRAQKRNRDGFER